ncbi:MAG: thiopurine S-methyltransferase [Myxococcota bacterium]
MTQWHERWRDDRIGFHRSAPNPNLTHHALGIRGWPGSVFLPLCGKTLDMIWLSERGARVVGNELVPKAVRAFFEENGLEPEQTPVDGLVSLKTKDIEILQGDFFDLRKEHLGSLDWAFDRGSLIALPPDLRPKYCRHLIELLGPGKEILLVHVEYDQEKMKGPPFSVSIEELRKHFDGHDLTLLDEQPALQPDSPFRAHGLTWLTERVWRIVLS